MGPAAQVSSTALSVTTLLRRTTTRTHRRFQNGLVLNIDGQLWQITEFQHVKPGKGPAFVPPSSRTCCPARWSDKTTTPGVKVEPRRWTAGATYLYRDGADFVFMDSGDYEQHPLPESLVGNAPASCWRMPVQIAFNEGQPALPRTASHRRTR